MVEIVQDVQSPEPFECVERSKMRCWRYMGREVEKLEDRRG
jgi:hypothetical protein